MNLTELLTHRFEGRIGLAAVRPAGLVFASDRLGHGVLRVKMLQAQNKNMHLECPPLAGPRSALVTPKCCRIHGASKFYLAEGHF